MTGLLRGLRVLGKISAEGTAAARTASADVAEPRPAEGRDLSKGPYDAAIERFRSTATWISGALAAVATAMVAGSQLSNIGQLSVGEPTRLAVAVAAAVVAVAAVLWAVFLLSGAQTPVESHLGRLDAAAADPASEISLAAKADKSFTRGRDDVGELLGDLRAARSAYYGALAERDRLQDAALQAAAEDRKAAEVDLALAEERLKYLDARLDDLLKGARGLLELDAYLNVKKKFNAVRSRVFLSSLVAAGCFVVFAWASNPPPAEDEAGVVEARPVAARVRLTAEDAAARKSVLGADCVALAQTDEGLPVIALSRNDDEISVVVLPSASCEQPVELTVAATQVAAEQAVRTG